MVKMSDVMKSQQKVSNDEVGVGLEGVINDDVD